MPVKILAKVDARQALEKLEELAEQAKPAGRRHVYVGIFASATYSDGTRVADIARANNFGTLTEGGFIPPRPFLTQAFHNNAAGRRLHRDFGILLRKKVNGGTPFAKAYLEALDALGQAAAGEVRRRVSTASEWAVPNAPRTAARKGEDKPLRDEGVLLKSITSKLR